MCLSVAIKIVMATDAREAQRSLDGWCRDASIRGIPGQRGRRFTLKAAAWMTSVFRDSNIRGWGSCGSFEIIH